MTSGLQNWFNSSDDFSPDGSGSRLRAGVLCGVGDVRVWGCEASVSVCVEEMSGVEVSVSGSPVRVVWVWSAP